MVSKLDMSFSFFFFSFFQYDQQNNFGFTNIYRGQICTSATAVSSSYERNPRIKEISCKKEQREGDMAIYCTFFSIVREISQLGKTKEVSYVIITRLFLFVGEMKKK